LHAKIKNATEERLNVFSLTAKGKVKRSKAFASHILTKKLRKEKEL